MQGSVGSNQEVGDNPRSREPRGSSILCPEPACQGRGLGIDGLEPHGQKREGLPESIIAGEVRSDLGPHHVAGHQRAGIVGPPERLPRPVPKPNVRPEHIEEH